MASKKIETILKDIIVKLGFDALKEEQKVAVLSFLSGRDVSVSLPTGYGKSLCYGCLPWVFNSLKERSTSVVVVVSPLIALMKDQVDIFTSRGLRCARAGECNNENDGIVNGEFELVFISPEAILSRNKWRKMLLSDIYQKNLVALVIDEAHCVKKW